jgi:hypothetical protein
MADKYTAAQYAQMAGGHNLEESNKGLTFMQGLGEARMFKTREQIKSEGARSITDHLFVSLLSLYAMSNDYNYAPVAKEYAKRTAQLGGFNRPSPSGTDLYQTVYTLGKPEGLLGSEKDAMLLGKVKLDQTRIKQFLKKIEIGNVTPGEAQAFFFKLERDLAIQDPKLRAARRLTQNWNSLTSAQQQLVATQIGKYYRIDARRSDLHPLFSSFAKDNGLVVSDSKLKKVAKRAARGAAAFAIGYAAGKATEL